MLIGTCSVSVGYSRLSRVCYKPTSTQLVLTDTPQLRNFASQKLSFFKIFGDTILRKKFRDMNLVY